jgi:hypothetical protein
VGEVATEDIGVEVYRLEATGRGMAHHSGARRVGRSAGEGPEERRRLELELSASSMGRRQSSWHGRLGRRCRVDGAVLSRPGRTASTLLW